MTFSNVYGFSNENLTEYNKVFNFENKDVLSVLGSGDQYLMAKLYGADTVDVFDNNAMTWYYFVLKFYGIRVLDYEEFYQFFVKDNLNNIKIYNKIKPHLPQEIRDFYEYLLSHNRLFSSIKMKGGVFNVPKKFDGRFIPYFDSSNYYKLQDILQNEALPQFINTDILSLDLKRRYDIMLASNIYHYLKINAREYKKFLLSLRIREFQAHYSWIMSAVEGHEFDYYGFETILLNPTMESEEYLKDKLILLRR